jgi:hypothetical protein
MCLTKLSLMALPSVMGQQAPFITEPRRAWDHAGIEKRRLPVRNLSGAEMVETEEPIRLVEPVFPD